MTSLVGLCCAFLLATLIEPNLATPLQPSPVDDQLKNCYSVQGGATYTRTAIGPHRMIHRNVAEATTACQCAAKADQQGVRAFVFSNESCGVFIGSYPATQPDSGDTVYLSDADIPNIEFEFETHWKVHAFGVLSLKWDMIDPAGSVKEIELKIINVYSQEIQDTVTIKADSEMFKKNQYTTSSKKIKSGIRFEYSLKDAEGRVLLIGSKTRLYYLNSFNGLETEGRLETVEVDGESVLYIATTIPSNKTGAIEYCEAAGYKMYASGLEGLKDTYFSGRYKEWIGLERTDGGKSFEWSASGYPDISSDDPVWNGFDTSDETKKCVFATGGVILYFRPADCADQTQHVGCYYNGQEDDEIQQ